MFILCVVYPIFGWLIDGPKDDWSPEVRRHLNERREIAREEDRKASKERERKRLAAELIEVRRGKKEWDNSPGIKILLFMYGCFVVYIFVRAYIFN